MNFSFHEIGYYDLPAVIDYILQITEEEKLYYVGHSMGTTSCFVLCSTRPEYNQKLASIISIAPVVFLANTKSPLARRVGQKLARLKAWSNKYSVYEYPARKNKFACQRNGRTAASLFENNFLFIAAGYKQSDIDQVLGFDNCHVPPTVY
uniref:AB hydrolase-1 domain-containing protein n=1 Tax=Timema poppense TaxID=170557 RepID=A0A7R9DHY3_TIMPO|nr:unnamed protein product [Timema poppensis]